MANKSRYQKIVDDLKSEKWDFRVNDLDEGLEYSLSKGGWMLVNKYTESRFRTQLRELGYGVRGKKKPSFTEVDDVIHTLADEQRYNPIRDYFPTLEGKYEPGDNGPYVNRQFAKFFTNPDRMFGTWLFKWMVGAIAKIEQGQRNPMLVLVGPQKQGKSWFAEWICPVKEYFLRDSINPDDKDSHIRLTDHFIWEVEELGATTRRSDVESLKAFITRDKVKKRPAYGKQLISKPALCSQIGTVNNDGSGFLNDFTGTTRFLSCEVREIDFDYTITDVNLLWAEAYWFYKNVPTAWELTPEQEAKQSEINRAYEVPSALEEVITELYIITGDKMDFITTSEIKGAVALKYRIPGEHIFHRELARVLTRLGAEKARGSYKKDQEHKRGWSGLRARHVTVQL